jgi:hypothetical protein
MFLEEGDILMHCRPEAESQSENARIDETDSATAGRVWKKCIDGLGLV